MIKNKPYDFIIAGAGASGLSLLWYLLESDVLKNKSILLLNYSFEPDDSKTWCFWEDDEFEFSNIVHHSWPEIQISTFNQTFLEKLKLYTYHCIRSKTLTKNILDEAKKDQRVTLVECEIIDFEESEFSSKVITSEGNFYGKMIFQSVLKPPSYQSAKNDISLIQHFKGWEIEVDEPFFNPDTALLMDFDVPQKNGVSFMYVLPFSQKKALVEYTIFSEIILPNEVYDAELKSYVNSKLFPSNSSEISYNIIRQEQGKIPMNDRRYSPWYCKNVYTIGTLGGLTKPSTGYTFTRIQKNCRNIVFSLEKNEELPSEWSSSYRFRVYDIMLLYQLKTNPDISPKIFKTLFEKNDFDLVFQFLDEKTTILDELKIFSTMPYLQFFKSIWKMKHRIFTGV